jgi:hypothetical protein
LFHESIRDDMQPKLTIHWVSVTHPLMLLTNFLNFSLVVSSIRLEKARAQEHKVLLLHPLDSRQQIGCA